MRVEFQLQALTNFHFYVRRTMVFNTIIQISVAPNLAGPPGWDHVTIVMAFKQNAIQSDIPFTPVAWKSVYSGCTIN